MRYLFFYLIAGLLAITASGQIAKVDVETGAEGKVENEKKVKPKILYGIASYYAEKFNGRPTANGEIYSGKKLTAACNVLPLGSLIKVTNLNNNKSVIVKTNDRLHPRMKRIVDLSRAAAEILGYTGRGLTQVKVEVLERN
jgi:rare lipoprotein A